jgi:RNA polymerase sigma factor (sigma-70 family)
MLAKLIYQAQSGNRAALAEIVERFQSLVIATARRLHSGGIPWLDFVQEGNLALVEAVYSFNPRGSAGFPWYARRRVYYALYNYRRRLLRSCGRELLTLDSPLFETEEGTALIHLLSGGDQGVEERILSKESYHSLRLALARLPEKQRQVMHALYFQEQRLTDVAKELGIGPSAVKGLEKRGLNNLRKLLGEG